MRAVVREAYAKGLRIQSEGTGIARVQAPAPGMPLRPGEKIRVLFVAMNLQQVLADVGLRKQIPEALKDREITGLDYDSRRIEPGWLFFAFPGSKIDGRQFARDGAGAGRYCGGERNSRAVEGFTGPWLEVEHGRRALSTAARNFYGHPDRNVALTGITGTNGKTTTSFLIDSVLRAAGHVTALIGTIEYHLRDRVLPAVEYHAGIAGFAAGCWTNFATLGGRYATMEVSSHALDLGRVYGFDFQTAVFTNLTQDHLDYPRDDGALLRGEGAPVRWRQRRARAAVCRDQCGR